MNRHVQRVVMASMAIVVAMLTACSGGGQPVTVSAGAAELADAAAATNATTYSFDLKSTVVQKQGESVTSSAHGGRSGQASTMTMEIPLPGRSASMEFIVGETGRQFLRYRGMPDGTPLPDGWIELIGLQGAAEAVTASASVGSFLDAAKRKDAVVEDRGVADRGGRETHRYRTVLDLSAAYRVETSNRMFRKVMEASAKTMSNLETDFEVDAQGRVNRIAYRLESAAGTATAVLTMSGFGEAVAIAEPSDARALTMDEFAELVYPTSAVPGGVDPPNDSDLVTRGVFIEEITASGEVTADLAGCIYDELKDSNPWAIAEHPEDSGLSDDEIGRAFSSAATICAMAATK